jgi:peptidyl-prolyl cis-trans isomerase B (cyclophilin B)
MTLFSKIIAASILCSLSAVSYAVEDTAQPAEPANAANPKVKMNTSLGDMVIELNAVKAPNSVANFLSYVDAGFYTDTLYHRVISNFMIQGGGFDLQQNKKATQAPIKNEANNGLKNKRGTIAMARTGDPHSATSQFFINVVDNASLDFRSEDPRGWGYAVFGKVTEGLDTMDKIRYTRTVRSGRFQNLPAQAVVINSVTRITTETKPQSKEP